ncbi:MAG: TetR/AcrR family transcriptional regulator [Nocardioidaceae bacterium]|nr:TetR/AcrR family transcriptional regulator [Nocardioidaceae bacterium]
MTAVDGSPRERIVTAAHGLFLAGGYLGTTMGEIATEAGVSLLEVFDVVGSKAGALAAVVDEAVVGDAEPVALLDRAWVAGLGSMSTEEALRSVVANLAEATERASPVHEVVASAASDPEVGALLSVLHAQRVETCARLAELVAPSPTVVDLLADQLYAVVGPECFHLLVVRRGWSRRRWERWAEQGLTAALAAT